MPKVYGVDVSKRAAVPASNFMHTQSALCGCSMLSGVISLLFTLIMLSQLQPLLDLQTKTVVDEKIPTRDQFMENVSKHAWAVALTQICEAACFGSILVAIGRHFIQTGSSGGMRLCCVVDGVYSVCGLCQGFLGCIGFIFLCTAVSQMDNAAEMCLKYSVTPAPGVVAATTAAPYFATTATCPQILAALKKPATTFLLWIGTLVCTICIVGGICGAGSKFAGETHEIFEDEEYGDFEEDDNAY